MTSKTSAGARFVAPHPWDVTPEQAIAIQQALRDQVITEDAFPALHTLAGVDVGFEDEWTITRAAVVVLSYPQLEVREQFVARLPTSFPYVPGLLSFREVPAVLAALEGLSALPDLVICDGQGIAHPRRLGIASHLGVVTGLPTIGAAKKRLFGSHGDVPPEKGGWVPLRHKQETLGAVLRTRVGVKPLYVSVGHKVGLATAIKLVLACTTRYRLPETTRHAHRLASPPRSPSASGSLPVQRDLF